MSTSLSPATLSRVVRACVLGAGVLFAADLAAAQAPTTQPQQPATAQPAQPAQPAAQVVSFDADGGIVFWQIKPDRTADFELVITRYREALQKSEDPVKKQMASGLKVYKTSAWVPPGGSAPESPNVLYLLMIDPVVKGADYSSTAMLKQLYEAFPTEGQDLYKKFVESAAGGRNVLNLQRVGNVAQP